MMYRAIWPNSEKQGLLTTMDEIVVDASPNMDWSVGRTLYAVFAWFEHKGIKLYVVDADDNLFLIGDMG